MKVELSSNTNEWEELPDDSPGGIYLDGYIKEKLDNILVIQKKGWDAVILIDGKERSGKSTLGMTLAWYLSKKKLTIDNFAKGVEDAKEKIKKLPDKSTLMIDEGSLVFNSKDSRKNTNIQLQKIMDVVGQKNMIFIVILPSIFDLSRSLAARRSLFLLHVFVDEEWKRGGFAYYGEEKKEVLYIEGKKNYNKYTIEPEFVSSFVKFEPPFNKEYLKLKQDTLMRELDNGKPVENKTLSDLRKEVRLLKYRIYLLMLAVPLKTQGELAQIVQVNSRHIRKWGEFKEALGL